MKIQTKIPMLQMHEILHKNVNEDVIFCVEIPLYKQWTIPSLLHQTKWNNPLGHKGLCT